MVQGTSHRFSLFSIGSFRFSSSRAVRLPLFGKHICTNLKYLQNFSIFLQNNEIFQEAMRSSVSAILSDPAPDSTMAFPDYQQSCTDHARYTDRPLDR